jgi:hypothetical protein
MVNTAPTPRDEEREMGIQPLLESKDDYREGFQ